jgi:hypothetical protein
MHSRTQNLGTERWEKSELSASLFFFSGVYYKHESDPLFIGDKENGYNDFTVF